MYAPPLSVLSAFGCECDPIPLDISANRVFRCGECVLKRIDSYVESEGTANLQIQISSDEFRMPRPIQSRDGTYVYEGWTAFEYLDGKFERGRWEDVIDLCITFHDAVFGFLRPAFLDDYENPWTIADHAVWDEQPYTPDPKIASSVEKLQSILRAIDQPSQLIHGDFSENVLFSENNPPVVIDFSPYWRPAGFALGIVVADALVWGGADDSIFEKIPPLPDFDQLLARAELRRIIELDTNARIGLNNKLDEIVAHQPTIDLICERNRQTSS